MQDDVTRQEIRQEINDRLNLIENMIAEGRRTTESWGWTFVLWGAAYMIALAWSAWGPATTLAWPVTMVAAIVVTAIAISMQSGKHPETTMGRAVVSIWIALGVTMFLLFLALSISGRLSDPRIFFAVASAILGMANGASGLILRWRMQLASAVVWWAAAVACCFGSVTQGLIVFLAALFLCQIAFGIYCMVMEARVKRQRGALHV